MQGWATQGSSRASHEAERVKRRCGQEKSFHCGFHGKELVNQVNIQGLAGLNALGRLWDIEAVPSCLVFGWYVIRARG